MYAEINFKENLTLGKLREIINNELSEFPDDIQINMHVDTNEYNVIGANCTEHNAPIMSILADNESIDFYNYI